MSQAAVYNEIFFWFIVVLTLLLVMFIGIVFTTPTGTADSPQTPKFSSPAPPPSLVRPRQPVAIAGTAAGSVRAAYRPRHGGALKPDLMVADRLQVSGGPPWEPAYAGAHRQARHHGAHRAGMSASRERRSASQPGRHRAGVR